MPLPPFKVYAGFIKVEHTLFSLPLIFAGALLAPGGALSARLAVLILLAAVAGRIVAMGLNRLIDAGIDAKNPRTKERELPRGAMRRGEAWGIVALAGLLYVASAWAIAPICVQLSPIPVALFVVYPYLKRFTVLSHLGLGLAWSLAPLGGWIATAAGSMAAVVPSGVEGRLTFASLGEIAWLWLFSVLWVTGFDIIYAMMDEAFDREFGLHSLPAQWGKQPALRVAAMLHLNAFIALILLWRMQLHAPMALAWLVGIGALFLWQHAIAERRPAFAFFQLNGALGFLVFGFIASGI